MHVSVLPTIEDMVRELRDGGRRERFVQAALDAIAAGDGTVQAWVQTDPAALAAAAAVEVSKPLAGVPFGVKDVIDLRGVPTRGGVDFLAEEPAQTDAWCVGALRAAGAIPVGKTQTTSFAFSSHPAPTYNPWNRERTPGGSSAGSAAAVAAGHVPFALGTQTAGSTLRPASFNGVVGFKPTFGRVPTAGVWALGPSCDHVGIIARTTGDVEQVFAVLDPAFDPVSTHGLRVLCDVDFYRDITGEDGRALLSTAVERLRHAGMDVRSEALPADLLGASATWQRIVSYEAYAMLGALIAGTPGRPLLHERVEAGRAVPFAEYKAAFRERDRLRGLVDALFDEVDAIVTLTAGPVPTRETTGNQSTHMVRVWTLLGNPSISVPIGLSEDGMPVGAQLIARRGDDARLLALARRLEGLAGPQARS